VVGSLLVAASLVAAGGCARSSRSERADAAIVAPERPGPVRVATSGDYAPFSLWLPGEPEPRGFSADVARAFARDRDRPIEWIRFRWTGLAADLESDRFDLALSGITVRPDRSLAGRFSLPLTATGAVALVDASSRFRSRADLDAGAVRIAVNRGGHLERVAHALFPNARIEAIAGNAEVPARLAAGRADAVLTDDLEAAHWQRAIPGARAIGPLTRDRKAAWLPPARTDLARDFDRWLLEAESTGELARLRARHGLAAEATALPLPALLARLDERLALMPAVAEAKRILARPVADAAQEARVHEAVQRAILQAAREHGGAAPAPARVRRFVDANLAAARFVQTRVLAAAAAAATTGARIAPPVDSPEREDGALEDAAREEAVRVELDERIRPALAYVTERIAWLAVAAAARRDGSPPPTREEVRAALAAHALPDAILGELQAALAALVTPPPNARRAEPARPARSARADTRPSA